MKTLSTAIATQAAAEQSAWVELYDIYLKSAITTPWGTTNVLRLCNRLGKSFAFFTPESSPEPTGTQGDAATYYPWPLKREIVKASSQFADNKLEIAASNVTAEWAGMVSTIDWYDTPVVIRKTSLSLTGATASDCSVLFSGLVDAIKITDTTITLVCSNDLALLNRILPSENMHASCRFRWADDQCTLIRFKTENYKTKSARNDSTTTLIKSLGLTEDAGSSSGYGTDLVNALSNGSITASSELGMQQIPVTAGASFAVLSTNTLIWAIKYGDEVKFISTAPSPYVVGTSYYVVAVYPTYIALSASPGGTPITNIGFGSYTIEVQVSRDAYNVKSSYPDNYWAFSTDADWGTVDNAYYVIPDAQSGLKNAALKPYIQFDFGSAKTPRIWRVSSLADAQDEQRLRIIQFFSSTNNSTWKFESYFEMPNRGGELFDVLIPTASSARYWRICVRSRWAESLYKQMFAEVQAYENGLHYWRDGFVTFASNTTTVGLRGVRRKVLASYSGEIVVQELPEPPVDGDEFVIERGCARTFNACCERQNTENYGGFNDLPIQTVIR